MIFKLDEPQINYLEPLISKNFDRNTGKILISFELRNKKLIIIYSYMDSNSVFINQMCAIKVKSKLEMYWLLLTDGKVYLPLIKQENYNYIIVILQEKKALKQSIIDINLYFWIIWSY